MIDSLRNPNKTWESRLGWSVADPTELAGNPMVIRGDRLLPWDRLPRSVDRESVETLRVFSCAATADRGLPAYLRRFTRLSALVIPPAIVPTLRPEMLPVSLKSLGIRDDISPRVKRMVFADGVSFPTVEELFASWPVVFGPAAFPSLRFLHLCLDRKRTMLARLGALPTVTALGLRPFNDPAIFESIGAMKLDWLALYGTRSVETLEGIERLGDLKALRLFEFPGLTSLEPLTRLPALSALEVSWCYKVADYEVLFRIPRLRQVEFYFCNMKLIAAIRPALEAKGVQFTQGVERQASG